MKLKRARRVFPKPETHLRFSLQRFYLALALISAQPVRKIGGQCRDICKYKAQFSSSTPSASPPLTLKVPAVKVPLQVAHGFDSSVFHTRRFYCLTRVYPVAHTLDDLATHILLIFLFA